MAILEALIVPMRCCISLSVEQGTSQSSRHCSLRNDRFSVGVFGQ